MIEVSLEEQLRIERQRNLALQAVNEELTEVIVKQLVDLEFRQLLNEMGVEL